jgi:hypothetical protein
MTPEGRIRNNAMSFAAAHSVKHQRMSFRPGVRRAFPDDQFLIPGGRSLFIEFKRPGKWPTPLQAHRLEELRELGYWATWADSIDAARSAILEALAAASLYGPRGGLSDSPALRRPTAPPGRAKDLHHA